MKPLLIFFLKFFKKSPKRSVAEILEFGHNSHEEWTQSLKPSYTEEEKAACRRKWLRIYGVEL